MEDGAADEVGREAQYELIAEEFDRHAEDGFYNAYYDRPACLSLLGDVTGQHVLDAACGPGLYALELHRRGARVTGFDQSSAMVELSRARVPQANFRVHDAADPLSWITSESVDAALLALALTSTTGSPPSPRSTGSCDHGDLSYCPGCTQPVTGFARVAATSTSGWWRRCGTRAGRCGTGSPHWNAPAKSYAERAS